MTATPDRHRARGSGPVASARRGPLGRRPGCRLDRLAARGLSPRGRAAPACCATSSSGRSTSGRSTSRSTARRASRSSPGGPVYSAMTEAAAAAAVHLPAVRGGARHPAGVDAVRGRRLAVDRAAGRGHRPPSSGMPAGGSSTAPAPGCRSPSPCSPLPMLWLHPVSRRHPVRPGQRVHGAGLPDGPARAAPGLLRRVPRGVLVGLAMAVKLTPGVFVVHYLVNRRWKEAATAVGTAVAVTLGVVGAAAGGVVRVLGRRAAGPRPGSAPTCGTSNQCIRGFLLRVGPDGTAGRRAVARAASRVVGVLGFRLARRALPARATRSARSPSIGLMAVPALTGGVDPPPALDRRRRSSRCSGADPLRDRRRLWAGVGRPAWFLCRLPWWGIRWLNHRDWPELPGRVLQNADTFGALVALACSGGRAHPLRGHRRRPVERRWHCTQRSADPRVLTADAAGASSSRGAGDLERGDGGEHQADARRRSGGWSTAASASAGSGRAAAPSAGDDGEGEERADEHRQRVVVACTTSDAVRICDRSPHSARKSTVKLTWRRPASPTAGRGALGANSSSVSASSSSAFRGAAQQQDAAEQEHQARERPRPACAAAARAGHRASTATTVCTRNASDTPIQTSSGRKRVASTSVAMKVLSGSSTRKMAPKTMAAVARSKFHSAPTVSARPVHRLA